MLEALETVKEAEKIIKNKEISAPMGVNFNKARSGVTPFVLIVNFLET